MLKLYLWLVYDSTLTLNSVHLLQWSTAISRERKNHIELVDDLYDANKNSTMGDRINIYFHFVFPISFQP